MDFLTILFIAWLITKAIASDAPYALRGKMPPKHLERMERLRRGEPVPLRYGLGDYLHDLWSMALQADLARRQRKAKEKQDTELDGKVPTPDELAPPAASGDPDEPPKGAAVPDPEQGPAVPEELPPVVDHGRPDDGVRDTCAGCTGCDRCKPAKEGRSERFRWTCARCGKRSGRGFPTAEIAEGDFDFHECGLRLRNFDEQEPPPSRPPKQKTDSDKSNGQVIPFPAPPPAQHPNPQGEPMNTNTTDDVNQAGTSEVTGLASAVQYTKGVAAAHASHGAGEAFVSSLRAFKVGEGDVALVQQAQEASRNAAAMWQAAADALINHNSGVREAYQAAPEAGDRQFVTSE